ncbi:tRNA-binding protein [Glycomyces sp. TRM65418]|uniref:tRNA-binding protein n=1 Tax=Glycomyces sp. TRM65418 TaxID=2867006 RepID=UPI001CE6BEDC|nr:tRNA-binding protein [Glycomyces sp. TRM65418]MCC3765709.1 tRNA-binding protein [Glycomyces sp. TRM65418]QZD55303.1 tRNA-binding protein [Glycomyces sp. TRM65418]
MAAPTETAEPSSVEDFFRTEIRAGRIVKSEPNEKARVPAYKLWIDFGDLGVKQSSAQITARYSAEALVGRTVVAVTNFPPRRIAGFKSEVLVLGVPVEGTDEVVLLAPDADVPLGARIA